MGCLTHHEPGRPPDADFRLVAADDPRRRRGRTNYKAPERETGVTRASIMRFVRGSQSLRLDMADRLAGRFGLELRPKRKGR
jgi:hypothetical protein